MVDQSCLGGSEAEMISEISKGETSRLEFKADLPDDHKKYLKTVVAFSNTSGGRILFGVTDKHKILGIPDETIHQVKDSVIDSIYHACEPPIMPYTYIMTIGEVNILVVEIVPGEECPYFIKSEGMSRGTYVRVGSTSMPATPNILNALRLRGRGQSFDMQLCLDSPIDERVLNSLCTRLSSYKVPVSPINLENMRVIKRLEDQYVATNAYVLLTSNHFLHTEVQCVCYRGTGKTVILDSCDSKSDIVTQTVEALSFVLRHISMASKIDGLVRRDVYEVPEVALREAIVNAIVHREYAMQDSSISIEIYDDRIDIGSPGLPLGLDIHQPEMGRSKIRNPAIAAVFKTIGFIEKYGTGVQRMISECKENNVPVPEFIEDRDYFIVRFYRVGVVEGDIENHTSSVTDDLGLTEVEIQLLKSISTGEFKSIRDYSKSTDLSRWTIEHALAVLIDKGLVKRVGSSRYGRWISL